MQRFKLDLSFEQFLMFARGEHVDIAGVKFEVYEADEVVTAKPLKGKRTPTIQTKPRAKRRTKAEMEAAKAEPKKAAADYSKADVQASDAHQRAFPWQDKGMNTPPEAA